MSETILVRHVDDPDGVWYEFAPPEFVAAIQRRFDPRPVVIHPSKPNVFIYDPGNFWDGATHVTWLPEVGHFTFDGWSGREFFPLVGPLR